MPDSGRLLYKQVAADTRIRQAFVDGKTVATEEAISAAVSLLRAAASNRSLAIVGSGRQSVEEQYLTRKLAAAVGAARTDIVGRVGQGDGLLLSADRNPNLRGALVTGLIKEYPATNLSALGAAIDAGTVRTILTCGEDLAAAGLSADQLAKVAIIEICTHPLSTTAAAKVVLPALTVFEKRGSFINQQFRLQKFNSSVPGPAQAMDDLGILARLISGATATSLGAADVDAVWTELSKHVATLGGLSWASLPSNGKLIDGTAWAGLPFVEGETMHFKPAAKTAVA
jgi:NADH-quinone oxidoreductase subunit G